MKRYLPLILIAICIVTNFVEAQTTEFTYQGKLNDGSIAATGDYNFEFRLFSVNTGGTVISTIQRLGVPVSSGVFTVKLDFGANFDGQPRWLEIAIKPAGDPGGFQQLLPRQPVTSAPYSIRSLNASTADTATNATTATNAVQLGGVAASQYVLTGDARLSDARFPLPGSGGYVQNRTSQQGLTDFNISGDGTAGGTLKGDVVNAVTQFNIGGSRVLSTAGTDNLFAGVNAGLSNTGSQNAFFGRGAGFANTFGSDNAFYGYQAGNANTTGGQNSFFGSGAGLNTTSDFNSFFGYQAGAFNTTGDSNAFFGIVSGYSNTTGTRNVFIGNGAGYFNITGQENTFVGSYAGNNNKASSNTFVGDGAGTYSTNGANNTIVGSSAGTNNSSGNSNVFLGRDAGDNNTTGNNNTIIGKGADVDFNDLSFATAIGASAVVSASNTIVLGRANASDTVVVPGKLQIDTLGTASATNLCINGLNRISSCTSSLRYKTDVQSFNGGLDVVLRLRPISFAWKDNPNSHDVGFGAEEVEKVAPDLVTYRNGEIEGVKYGQISTVLVNALKEQQQIIENQQKQIDAQQKQIEQQKKQFESLTKIVCAMNSKADICR